jgi:hypothetical protein
MAACQPTVVAPFLDGVTPNWGFNGEQTDVRVLGQNLFAGMDASGGGIEGYDRDFVVELIGTEQRMLGSVQQLTSDKLAATVPAGLTPGWYELAVTTPGGLTARLGDAFEVTNTKADSLRLTTERITIGVNEFSIIQMSLRSPDGELVPDPVPVRVMVTGTSGESDGIQFNMDGLVDASELIPGQEVAGWLGPSGEAFIGISSNVPDTVWVTVEATIRDRVVVTATQLINFIAGDVTALVIGLAGEPGPVVAGEEVSLHIRLVDASGSTVSGTTATVALRETCFGGQFQATHTFVDDALITAHPTMACPANGIHAFGVVEGIGVEGETAPFEVVAGELDGLNVTASPDVVVAGVEDLTVFVQGVDRFLNPTPDDLGELEIYDEALRIDVASGNGTYECSPLMPGQQSCSVRLFEASESRILEARSPLEAHGFANAIQVRPGPVASIEIRMDGVDSTAGIPFGISLSVLDAFHNTILLGESELASLLFFDAYGSISCTHTGTDFEERSYEHECILTTAGDGNQILAVSSDTGASGESGEFSVFPGALNVVVVTVDDLVLSEGITAGGLISVAFEGMDSYDNRVTGSHTLGLENVAGGMIPSEIALTDGIALSTVQLRTANPGDSIWVTEGTKLLGGSAPIAVAAGSPTGLAVTLSPPWALVGEPVDVRVVAVDEYANPADADHVVVELTSRGGLGPAQVHLLGDGESIAYTFDTAGIGDHLEVVGGGWSGGFGPVDVGLLCPGVEAEIAFGGSDDSRVCSSGGGLTEVEATWELPGYIHGALYLDGESVYRGTDGEVRLELPGPGSGTVTGFFLDDSACGAPVTKDYWVAAAGDPIGLVNFAASTSSLVTGLSGGLSEAEFTVDAETCTGDGAGGGQLIIRSRGGALESADGGALASTGAGLGVTLSDDGDGLFALTVEDFAFAGSLDVMAGTKDGSAFGVYTVDVAGDSTPPQVWSCSPWGRTMVSTDVLVVEFSEPMLVNVEAAIDEGWVVLSSDEGGVVGIESMELDEFGDTLTVFLDASIDTGVESWTLLLIDEFRDEAGNRLDGDNDGAPGGDWTRMFGDVADTAPDVTKCMPSTGWFAPDGDDGSDREADSVHLELNASDEAEWWRIDVMSQQGEWLWAHTVSSGRSMEGFLVWGGRDASGMVVPNGVYILRMSALDIHENAGEVCVVSVSVDNHIGIPAGF